MTTQLAVDKAKEQYDTLVKAFLFERGWEYDLRKLYPWTKWTRGNGMHAKDAQEAYSWEVSLGVKVDMVGVYDN